MPPVLFTADAQHAVEPIVSPASKKHAAAPDEEREPYRRGEDFLVTGAARLDHPEWQAFHMQRHTLLTRTLTLRISNDVGIVPTDASRTFTITLADHPGWITARYDRNGVIRATVDAAALRSYLERTVAPLIQPVSHLRILSLPDDDGTHAQTEGKLRNGWNIQSLEAARYIARGVGNGRLSFTIPIQSVQAKILNETGQDLGDLTLLARGRSNFAGSVPNRIYNIEKALDQHVSSALVPPGGTFDFNALLGGPVDVSTGWKLSLGIFGNGTELSPTPGGGICQASTTVFRAIAAAGLPIEERSNHSMYIKYYKQFGEGLDAAVFPGSKNLVAVNDTEQYILFHGYIEGDNAYVELYGTPDGRKVSLEGPYRWHDAPDDLTLPDGRRPWKREIVWRQRIERPDGETEEHVLRSYYMTEIPDEAPKLAGEVTIIQSGEQQETITKKSESANAHTSTTI